MKTNKEFGDYVFEKAEKYKAKRAAAVRRTVSYTACCLVLAFVVAIMGMNGIFDIGDEPSYNPHNGRSTRIYREGSNAIVPFSVDAAMPTAQTATGNIENDILTGNVYFYIKTYNTFENEYTILKSAEDFQKYSSFISNIEDGGENFLVKIEEAANKADFSKTELIVLRVSEEESAGCRVLIYGGAESNAYRFTLKSTSLSENGVASTDYYIIFVPRENAEYVNVDFEN